MDHRGDVEDHTWNTHGVDLNEIDLESSIKVNESEALVLSAAMTFKELSLEGRKSVYNSWFDACAANGTVTKLENRENAKIQKHKAGNFLKALKTLNMPAFTNIINFILTNFLFQIYLFLLS